MVCDTELSFRSIDFVTDCPTLLTFGQDLFTISFEDPDWFIRQVGAVGLGYVDWLMQATGRDYQFASFALIGGVPVGMVALGPEPQQPAVGHVFHYYLSPCARGRGFGKALNDRALAILSQRGMVSTRLHVSPGNTAALSFYAKVGWVEAGVVTGKGVVAMTTLVEKK
jgi:ribosomal protein S18 acetylase RimI-like enzyme